MALSAKNAPGRALRDSRVRKFDAPVAGVARACTHDSRVDGARRRVKRETNERNIYWPRSRAEGAMVVRGGVAQLGGAARVLVTHTYYTRQFACRSPPPPDYIKRWQFLCSSRCSLFFSPSPRFPPICLVRGQRTYRPVRMREIGSVVRRPRTPVPRRSAT